MWHWKNNLANRLSLFISLIIIGVFVGVGLLASNYMEGMISEKVKTENILKARSISQNISNIFENNRIIVQQMAANQQIVRYLKEVDSRDDIKKNKLYPDILKTLAEVRNYSDIYNIAWIANTKVSFYIDDSGYLSDKEYDIQKRPWFSRARGTYGVSFSTPYIDYGTKEMITSCIMTIREHDQVIGFTAVDMVINNIPAFFKEYKIGKKGLNFLISRDGTFIYHDDSAMIMKENILDSGGGLQHVGNEILSSPNNNGFLEIVYHGDNYFLAWNKITESDWIVGSLINRQEALAEIIPFLQLLMILLFLALIIMMGTVLWAVRLTTAPFAVLTKYARDIAGGNISNNLPEKYLKRDDEMGQLSRDFQIITDVFRSENVVLAEKVEEKNQQLKKQYKYIMETEKMAALGELVAGVAHEINTPLGIGLSTASYIDKINKESRQRLSDGSMSKTDLMKFMGDLNDSVEMMLGNLERAAELIKNFKRVAVDQTSGERMQFKLRDNIEAVILSLRHEYKKKNFLINNDCPDNIVLNSYPGAYSQIFTNLIMNSIKHGFKLRDCGTIIIRITKEGDFLHMVYSDDGVGISEDNLERIYDPFFTTNRAGGGSGLGLHIVFNIVSRTLRGKIDCISRLDEGTHFIIDVPVNPDEPVAV